MRYWISCIVVAVLCLGGVYSWDNDDLEIFDLVEEVNTNFYSLLGVEQAKEYGSLKIEDQNGMKCGHCVVGLDLAEDTIIHHIELTKLLQRGSVFDFMEGAVAKKQCIAVDTGSCKKLCMNADAVEIRRAYRRLSLVLHPDKNDAPDAEIKFRQLVAVYDVLRDGSKRMRYDEVLRNGLPDWRQAVYYYRRVRKMGLAEMLVILSVLLTVGQYGVAWASYVEKKYNAEQYLNLKLKRLQKKVKKGKYDGPPLPETIELDIPSPSLWNTLPFQLPRFVWFCITMCPQSIRLLRQYLAERNQKKEEETSSEEEVEVEVRPARRRKGKFAPPELKAADQGGGPQVPDHGSRRERQAEEDAADETPPVVSGGLWTDDDIVELVRLVKKFPQGITGRWEKIASAMNRPVGEVTHMARKVKEDGYRVGRPDDQPQQPPEEEPRKVKTKGGKLGPAPSEEDSSWTQQQQKALEVALVKFPKGGTQDRWEKIAKCVPGKSKEECMLRYKYLADLVKRRKENGEVLEAASV